MIGITGIQNNRTTFVAMFVSNIRGQVVSLMLSLMSSQDVEDLSSQKVTRNLYVVMNITMVRSWEEALQEVLLVDLAHLIPGHLFHQHQGCGDGVGCHEFPCPGLQLWQGHSLPLL